MCGAFGCLDGGGNRSRCFNSGYHDPELLQVDFLVVYVHILCYTFYALSIECVDKQLGNPLVTTRGHGTHY